MGLLANNMKYSIYINQVKAIEWRLNLTEASVFAFCYELPSWANSSNINGEIWYQYAKTKIINEYPLLTSKPDTIYRVLKRLEKIGLIKCSKIMNIDHLRLTDKARQWNEHDPTFGKKSELPEINPVDNGKKSESKAEKNPTYNNTNTHSITKDSKEPEKDFSAPLFPDEQKEPKKDKKTLFRNSDVYALVKFDENGVGVDYSEFEKKYATPEFAPVDLVYYFHVVADWSDQKNMKRTKNGWLATVRNFIRGDVERKKVHLKKEHQAPQTQLNVSGAMDFLNEYD